MALEPMKPQVRVPLQSEGREEIEVAKVLRDFGHISFGEQVPETILSDIHDDNLTLPRLEKGCSQLSALRNPGHVQAEREEIAFAAAYDLKNISGISVADSKHSSTNFDSIDVSRLDFSTIRVQGQLLDLTHDALALSENEIWQLDNFSKIHSGRCADCELLNKGILQESEVKIIQEGYSLREAKELFRRGVMLFQEGHPLGYMKLKGENTFLAVRTVRDDQGRAIFWKGMIYDLDERVVNFLKVASLPYKSDQGVWRRADMEAVAETFPFNGGSPKLFGRNNLRFLRDPDMYQMLSELTSGIEAGREPFVDIVGPDQKAQ